MSCACSGPKTGEWCSSISRPRAGSLKSKLVPLAEEVNGIGIRGIKAADVAVTRRTLLAILDNLALDEAQSSSPQRRIPAPVGV